MLKKEVFDYRNRTCTKTT